MNSLLKEWPKTTITSSLYLTVILLLFVKSQNFPLFLIWMHVPIYFLHEFEEYILPGGFLAFFNTKMLGSTDPQEPLNIKRSFWINVPLIFILYPASAILATTLGPSWGIWIVYFSIANALTHVFMFLRFGYNPGLIVSLLVNIPAGLYTVWYFASHHLLSEASQIWGLLIGLALQALMALYGFLILKPTIPLSQRVSRR